MQPCSHAAVLPGVGGQSWGGVWDPRQDGEGRESSLAVSLPVSGGDSLCGEEGSSPEAGHRAGVGGLSQLQNRSAELGDRGTGGMSETLLGVGVSRA